mgnify:CR=1 FL=1
MPDSRPPRSRPLTPKQRRFAEALPSSSSLTAAAIAAGYSNVANGAHVMANDNLHKPTVLAAVKANLASAAERNGVTVDWAFSRLHENVERSLQAIPVLDREGKPTGEYQYEPAAVNRGVELAMKHLKLLGDEATPAEVHNTLIFQGFTIEELRALVAKGKEQGS